MEPNQAYKKDQLASSATKTADLRAYHLECLNSVLARALIIFAQPCVTSFVAAKSRGKGKEWKRNTKQANGIFLDQQGLYRRIHSGAIDAMSAENHITTFSFVDQTFVAFFEAIKQGHWPSNEKSLLKEQFKTARASGMYRKFQLYFFIVSESNELSRNDVSSVNGNALFSFPKNAADEETSFLPTLKSIQRWKRQEKKF